MAAPEFLHTIESTGVSTWIRQTDSIFGFYFILMCHNFGLVMLISSNLIIDLRILGIASGVPLKALNPLFKIMWAGLAFAITTGLLLVLGYPTKALTNPLFYVKLTIVATSVYLMFKMKERVFDDVSLSEGEMIAAGKKMAMYSIILWACAITAGRFLAFTYTYIYYGIKGVIFFDVSNIFKALR